MAFSQEQIYGAIRKADAAGDGEAVKALLAQMNGGEQPKQRVKGQVTWQDGKYTADVEHDVGIPDQQRQQEARDALTKKYPGVDFPKPEVFQLANPQDWKPSDETWQEQLGNLGANVLKGFPTTTIPDMLAAGGRAVGNGLMDAGSFLATGGGASSGTVGDPSSSDAVSNFFQKQKSARSPSIGGAIDQLYPHAQFEPSAVPAQFLGSMAIPIGPKGASAPVAGYNALTRAEAKAASPLVENALGRNTPGGVVGNGLPEKARALDAAGTAEGVNINRAMVDPKLENRMTGVDSSMFGGPRVQSGMRKIEGQIEDRVTSKGGGTAFADKNAEGDAYRTAGERFIKDSGKSSGRQYDNAVNLAGDTKVPAKESLGVVDDMIGKLSETPNSNKAEIGYLQGLKEDLGKDLSVGALRDLRTTLRKKITGGDLVFGQNEGRVLGIMDAAGNDIRTGLVQAGKTDAAKAFDIADTNYRARMEYINGTLQKVIGKRNANISSEGVAEKLISLARGKDASGLREFYSKLNPDEAADVASTFADRIGRNGKEEFSLAYFLKQTAPKTGYSPRVLETLFGKDGAQSISNLRLIAKEAERVTKTMNSRKSGTGVANDWRSLLGNLVLGGGGGFGLAGGSAKSAIAGAVATGGAKAARDIFSARSLLSPDLTKWILRAPKTTDAAAIKRHMDQLGELAKLAPRLVAPAAANMNDIGSILARSPGAAAAQNKTD